MVVVGQLGTAHPEGRCIKARTGAGHKAECLGVSSQQVVSIDTGTLDRCIRPSLGIRVGGWTVFAQDGLARSRTEWRVRR